MTKRQRRALALAAAVQLHARLHGTSVDDNSRETVLYTAEEFERYIRRGRREDKRKGAVV